MMKRFITYFCLLSIVTLLLSSCGDNKKTVIELFSSGTVKADVEALLGEPVHATPLFVLYETTVKDQLAKVMVTYEEEKITSIRYDISFASNGDSYDEALQLFGEIKEQIAGDRGTPTETASGDPDTGEVITYTWGEDSTLSFTHSPALELITLERYY